MNDVLDRLAALHTDPAPAATATVAADLTRGRRALARRRARRGATAGVALAVVGLAGTTLVDRGPTDTGLDLVAYDGRQLPGFTVAKVPEGFVLQGANAHVLAVARADDTSTINDFADKLVVMVESTAAAAPAPTGSTDRREGASIERRDGEIHVRCADGSEQVVTQGPDERVDTASILALCGDENPQQPAPAHTLGELFEVDGDKATLSTNSEGAKIVRYEHGDRIVVVQMWPGLGLTDAELREFADGITVTAEAQVSLG